MGTEAALVDQRQGKRRFGRKAEQESEREAEQTCHHCGRLARRQRRHLTNILKCKIFKSVIRGYCRRVFCQVGVLFILFFFCVNFNKWWFLSIGGNYNIDSHKQDDLWKLSVEGLSFIILTLVMLSRHQQCSPVRSPVFRGRIQGVCLCASMLSLLIVEPGGF